MIKLLIYKAKRWYHFWKTGVFRGLPAEMRYKYPARKLKILAITGTDGKTTSSTMLYHVLKAAGKKVALVTTVAAYIGDEEIDTGFHVTTPDAADVQRFLAKMVEQGIEYVVLEATSHGLYQHRLWGVRPMIAGYTNITHEHLDYHITYSEYVRAKALLGEHAQHVVLNADDATSYRELKKHFSTLPVKLVSYSLSDTVPSLVEKAIKRKCAQQYNQSNARLVYAIARLEEISDNDFITGLKNFSGVPGRMQQVSQDRDDIRVIVDFAHTPNALEQALTAIRQHMKKERSKGKLIAVFGCAGLRDIQKRPMMGKIASELADLSVFTSEDPRTEDIWSIFREMKDGISSHHNRVLTIPDRKEAIEHAIIQLAQPGDVVGIFGKGHEKSLCYGTIEYPWSDTSVAQDALLERHAHTSPKKDRV